jgi:hypothetical protein
MYRASTATTGCPRDHAAQGDRLSSPRAGRPLAPPRWHGHSLARNDPDEPIGVTFIRGM